MNFSDNKLISNSNQKIKSNKATSYFDYLNKFLSICIIGILVGFTCVNSLTTSKEISETKAIENYKPMVENISDMTAKDIVDDITFGFNLGNSFDSSPNEVRPSAKNHTSDEGTDYETIWGNPKTTKEMIVTIKNKGFNAIRIPVTWNQHLIDDGKGNVTVSPNFINRVKEVVNYAYDEGMYVIINSHHDTNDFSKGKPANYALEQTGLTWEMGIPYMLFNCQTNNESQCLNVKRLWTTLANEFKDYDNHLIFEDFNEIVGLNRYDFTGDETQWKNLNNLNQAFVDAVRATGGNNSNRVLCLSASYGMSATNSNSMKYFNIKDTVPNKIIVQVHHYSKYTGSLTDEHCKKIKEYFTDKGYPVIFGETGFDVQNNSEYVNIAEATKQLTLCKNYGFKTFYWDAADFSIFDRNNLTWKSEKLVNTMLNIYKKDTTKTNIKDNNSNDDNNKSNNNSSKNNNSSSYNNSPSKKANNVNNTDSKKSNTNTDLNNETNNTSSENKLNNNDNNLIDLDNKLKSSTTDIHNSNNNKSASTEDIENNTNKTGSQNKQNISNSNISNATSRSNTSISRADINSIKKDNTTVKAKKLPQTGSAIEILPIIIVVFAMIATICIIRFKSL